MCEGHLDANPWTAPDVHRTSLITKLPQSVGWSLALLFWEKRHVKHRRSASAMEVLEWLVMKRDTRWRRAPHWINYMWSKRDHFVNPAWALGKDAPKVSQISGSTPALDQMVLIHCKSLHSSHQSQFHDLSYQETSLSSPFVPSFAHSVSHPTPIRWAFHATGESVPDAQTRAALSKNFSVSLS